MARVQLYEIASGLAYLHKVNVVHGDLRGVSGSLVALSNCSCIEIHKRLPSSSPIFWSTNTDMPVWVILGWPTLEIRRLRV